MKLFDVYSPFDIEIVKGRNYHVFDKHGSKYIDFYGGHAVISIGHSHPHFVERISQQLQMLPFYSNSINMPLQEELAEKLGRLSGMDDYHLFLCNSGAEANENALKLASFRTGKSTVIAYEKAFHGRTSAAVNVTDNDKVKAPINRGFKAHFLPWGDLSETERILQGGEVGAIMLEGIQGIGGIQVAGTTFLRGLRNLCDQYGAMLILDEIQSGFGRSGYFFAFQRAGIQPDVVSMAKGMGNGFPVGGVLIHPGFEARKGMLGTTFGGNHLACAATLAVLEILEREHLMENAVQLGNYLMEQLQAFSGVKEVRGSGLMIGLEMDRPIKVLRNHLLFEEQVFTGSSSNPNVIRLLPPLSIDRAVTDQFLERLQKVISKFTI